MASSLNWRAEYAIGHPLIDDQHRSVIAIIGDLAAAGDAGDTGSAIRRIGAYIGEHFACEESLMERSAYPRLVVHRLAHDDFRTLYRLMSASADARARSVALLAMLRWFITHITSPTADLHFGEHLRQRAAGR